MAQVVTGISCVTTKMANANATAPSLPPECGIVGGLTNPFPGGWQPSRLDMGYDGTFKNQIVAPFAGNITFLEFFNLYFLTGEATWRLNLTSHSLDWKPQRFILLKGFLLLFRQAPM